MLEHLALHESLYGSGSLAATLMRKHLLWYAKGFPGTKLLRTAFSGVTTLAEARELIAAFCARNNLSLERYTSAETQGGDIGERSDPKFEMDRELDRGVGHLEK